jgi:hypothetical protein
MRVPPLLRRLSTVGLAIVATISVVPVAEASRPPSPAECAETLRCDLDQFARMPLDDRVAFVRLLQRRASEFEPNFQRWNAIVAVLKAQRDHGHAEPGTWTAITGAGLLEGIERGTELAGGSASAAGNPGSDRWAAYLTDLAAEKLTYPPTHGEVWSNSEQVSLDYGDQVSREQYGQTATAEEQRFKQLTDLGRWALRNQKQASEALGPLAPVLWWFTDTRNEESYRIAGEVAVTLAYGPPLETLAELLRRIQERCPTCVLPRPS